MNRYKLIAGSQADISITSLVQMARAPGEGPQPVFSSGGISMDVLQGNYLPIILGGGAMVQKCSATPLITCAAVILVSSDPIAAPRAVVYHAVAGGLTPGILSELHAALQYPPLASILAVYAVTKPWDDFYNTDATMLETYGVPPANVVYIDNLTSNRFGINSHGQVGSNY